mmetsp:Transcript_5730/g.17289  ORF Transcript_5730/g.17289 Transcript_5730/m.17289 type:complete len:437 (+) Transcript_5730:80-1390(+)
MPPSSQVSPGQSPLAPEEGRSLLRSAPRRSSALLAQASAISTLRRRHGESRRLALAKKTESPGSREGEKVRRKREEEEEHTGGPSLHAVPLDGAEFRTAAETSGAGSDVDGVVVGKGVGAMTSLVERGEGAPCVELGVVGFDFVMGDVERELGLAANDDEETPECQDGHAGSERGETRAELGPAVGGKVVDVDDANGVVVSRIAVLDEVIGDASAAKVEFTVDDGSARVVSGFRGFVGHGRPGPGGGVVLVEERIRAVLVAFRDSPDDVYDVFVDDGARCPAATRLRDLARLDYGVRAGDVDQDVREGLFDREGPGEGADDVDVALEDHGLKVVNVVHLGSVAPRLLRRVKYVRRLQPASSHQVEHPVRLDKRVFVATTGSRLVRVVLVVDQSPALGARRLRSRRRYRRWRRRRRPCRRRFRCGRRRRLRRRLRRR